MTSNKGGSQQDEELAFWAWFFERISPISNFFTKIRRDVRGSPIGGFLDTAGQLLNDVSDTSHMVAQRSAELTYSAILRSPAYLIVTLLLASALIGWRAEDFEHQINGDVEIYLPDGANSTALLNEVRTQWSTDIVILYVQTDNAAEGAQNGVENITDANILNQISWIEGDNNNVGESGYGKGLDYNKEDRGSHTCNSPMTGCDGVVWILSPAQIIRRQTRPTTGSRALSKSTAYPVLTEAVRFRAKIRTRVTQSHRVTAPRRGLTTTWKTPENSCQTSSKTPITTEYGILASLFWEFPSIWPIPTSYQGPISRQGMKSEITRRSLHT